MASIDPKRKAGPVGRARLSSTLMRRPGLMDPRLRRQQNLLATNRRTARGVDNLALDYTAVPLGIQVELEKLVVKVNEIIANLKARGLMEQEP
jgi:hypothetical protein